MEGYTPACCREGWEMSGLEEKMEGATSGREGLYRGTASPGRGACEPRQGRRAAGRPWGGAGHWRRAVPARTAGGRCGGPAWARELRNTAAAGTALGKCRGVASLVCRSLLHARKQASIRGSAASTQSGNLGAGGACRRRAGARAREPRHDGTQRSLGRCGRAGGGGGGGGVSLAVFQRTCHAAS